MAHTLTHPRWGSRSYNDDTHDDSRSVRDTADHDMAVVKSSVGGFKFGAAFFGWLVSIGIAAILTGILGAAGGALAVTNVGSNVSAGTVSTIGLWSGIVFLIILAIAYYAGGYVAGRMVRFSGARQGFGVWAIGLIVTVVLALAGAILGAKYNVLQQINLPHIPIKQGTFTTGGLIASLIAIVVTLLAAIFGGAAGQRYHHKVDRAVTAAS